MSRLHEQTQTPDSLYDSTGRVISPMQEPLPDNIQHLDETDTDVPGGIRTHNSSNRTATDPRLKPRGNWDRLLWLIEEQTRNTEHWWNDTDEGTQNTWRNTNPGATLSNTNRLVR